MFLGHRMSLVKESSYNLHRTDSFFSGGLVEELRRKKSRRTKSDGLSLR
jgi:hypothetical protein